MLRAPVGKRALAFAPADGKDDEPVPSLLPATAAPLQAEVRSADAECDIAMQDLMLLAIGATGAPTGGAEEWLAANMSPTDQSVVRAFRFHRIDTAEDVLRLTQLDLVEMKLTVAVRDRLRTAIDTAKKTLAAAAAKKSTAPAPIWCASNAFPPWSALLG
jgi:hypothetical protein